jgi:hypothetical protein
VVDRPFDNVSDNPRDNAQSMAFDEEIQYLQITRWPPRIQGR